MPSINPAEFVASVQPMLERRDMQGLLDLLRSRWTRDEIISLLGCEDDDARKVAALSLAFVGSKCCVHGLASQLRHPDPMVNQMAEHALWSIWFRCGSPEANHELCQGTRAMNRWDLEKAIEHFTRAIEIDPNFAEAYNQRGIAHYLQDNYQECIRDCRQAVERMPCHFGAWAGLGHCHAHQGRFCEAVKCYERALSINPHLEGIPQAVEQLRERVS